MKRLDLKIPEDAYQDLEQLAARYGVGAGVLARMLLVRAITEESGESPESIRTVSGYFPETVREISGNRPEDDRTPPVESPENIRSESGKSPENVRTSSGEHPENVRKTSGSESERSTPSGQNPEDLRKTSGNRPEDRRTPASPPSPPITPLSPPGVFSQSADADCVASGDTANGRMVEVSRRNGSESDEDPTVRSKAVQIYRHFFGRYPTRDKRRIIADAVPEAELSAWRETLEEWKSEGWSATNVEGMIDRFKRRLEVETVELQDRAGSARSVKPSRPPIPYHEAFGLWEKRGQPGGKFPPDGWTMVTGPDGKAWFIVP